MPVNAALMVHVPWVRPVVETEAVPVASTGTLLARVCTAPPLTEPVKFTVPAAPAGVTVAVSVAGCSAVLSAEVAVTVVVVEIGARTALTVTAAEVEPENAESPE